MIFVQEKKIDFQEKKYFKKGTKSFNKVILSLFLGGLSTFSILYCVQSILPIFSRQFFLTPAASSLSLSIATGMMAIGMLFTGPLSDFFGRKLVMSSSLLIASVLTILCSMMKNWTSIIIIRALTGLSLSGVVAVAMTYISEEMDPNSFSISMGLYISGNTIGGCSGRLLSSFLSERFSWNVALMIIGFTSLISSCVFLCLLPPSRNFHALSINLYTLLKNFYSHLKHPSLRILFIIGFISMGSFVTIFNYISYRLILSPFFLQQSNIGLLSIIYLIGVYSSPKAGILIEKYQRHTILMLALLLMITGVIITQKNNLLTVILGLIMFSAGFFAVHSVASSWVSSCITIAKVQATSLYLFFYYLGSSVFGTFCGYFWSISQWLGISIFIITMLLLSIFLSFQLKQQ